MKNVTRQALCIEYSFPVMYEAFTKLRAII